MDYQEAIEYMRKESHNQCVNSEGQDAYIIAISAMQELHEYHKLGTLEEMKLLKETHLTGVELAQISCMLKQLAEYEKIGTLEKVRDAVERQKPKHPIIEPWNPARCPTCGEPLSEHWGDGHYRHRTFLKRCTNLDCAQRLDWSEEV